VVSVRRVSNVLKVLLLRLLVMEVPKQLIIRIKRVKVYARLVQLDIGAVIRLEHDANQVTNKNHTIAHLLQEKRYSATLDTSLSRRLPQLRKIVSLAHQVVSVQPKTLVEKFIRKSSFVLLDHSVQVLMPCQQFVLLDSTVHIKLTFQYHVQVDGTVRQKDW
jgi:hypothetical protein